MKTYLLPIEAEECINGSGTIEYKIRDSDSLMVSLNGSYINLNKNLMIITTDEENQLPEVFVSNVIAIRRGYSQLENKFIIDLFGKLGCKFNSVVHQDIKDGSNVAQYIYGQIKTGELFHTGSIRDVGKFVNDHERVKVQEVDLLDLMGMVQEKEIEENKV
jgi:hypothetical protein